jgi:hypothetical protein
MLLAMRAPLRSLISGLALLGATQHCGSQDETPGAGAAGGPQSAGAGSTGASSGNGSADGRRGDDETCGSCGEGCATRVWDPEARVAREYECTERDGNHDCLCDGAAVTVTRRVDCSEALAIGCGLDLGFTGYCQTDGAGVCWRAPGDSGAPVWQCQCAGSDDRFTSDYLECEAALFAGCPLSCQSEAGRCASGEALYSYDCECAGRATAVRDYLLRGDRNCGTLLALACEPACSGAIGRCFDLGNRIECLCGTAERLDTLPQTTGCEGALMTSCAGRSAETCSRVVDAGHATCTLDADGYLCACADYDPAVPGGVQSSDTLRIGAWREVDGTFTIDLDCEQAMREACPATFE